MVTKGRLLNKNITCTAAVPVRTGTVLQRYYNEPLYIIPYHLQPNNTRNIPRVYTYTRKKEDKEEHEAKKHRRPKVHKLGNPDFTNIKNGDNKNVTFSHLGQIMI